MKTTQKKTTSLEKTMNSYRNGAHSTIYELVRDPALQNKDVIRDDKKNVFPFIAGSSYNGQWKNDMKDGFGMLVYPDGTKYEGEWCENQRHGNGTLWIKQGKKSVKQYVGNWIYGTMEGFGVYYFENGEVYKGEWLNNNRHGDGRLEYPNGDYFVGSWENDAQQGMGILYLKNGNIFDGMWVNGKKEGPGKFFYSSTNKVYEGEWVDDQPQCGEYRAPKANETHRFGNPSVRKEVFTLPEIGLANPRAVLDLAISDVRLDRAPRLGLCDSFLSPEVLESAEATFQRLDGSNTGSVSIWLLKDVFADFGIELTNEMMHQVATQLELGDFATLSFPEVVDIATYMVTGEQSRRYSS